jgi:hypothetical protein
MDGQLLCPLYEAPNRTSVPVPVSRGGNSAPVRLAVIMHQMWTDGTDFRWSDTITTAKAAAA